MGSYLTSNGESRNKHAEMKNMEVVGWVYENDKLTIFFTTLVKKPHFKCNLTLYNHFQTPKPSEKAVRLACSCVLLLTETFKQGAGTVCKIG